MFPDLAFLILGLDVQEKISGPTGALQMLNNHRLKLSEIHTPTEIQLVTVIINQWTSISSQQWPAQPGVDSASVSGASTSPSEKKEVATSYKYPSFDGLSIPLCL